MPKVSVIIPVYNPGPNIDECIASTLGQSMEPADYEVIFVDDGSTDGTAARLDELAERHDHVRVEHIPNSGWPGRPRNIGIDLARGRYVFFMDNDDRLGPEALERMVAMADRDEADVLTGKVVGQGKTVGRTLFRRNRSHVTFDWGPLVTLLSPHKLFRRQFLLDHGIRFPEGHYRLEDHAFCLPAYFAARSISVLADYPCYYWVLRDLEVNASTQRFDAADYFGRVREILDIIVAHTEPGELRDKLLSHWYVSKVLARVGGQPFLDRPEDYRLELYEEIRAITLERFDPSFDARLSMHHRLRARLLRDGRLHDLMTLAAREASLEPKVTKLALRPRSEDARLRISLRGRLTGTPGGPLAFAPDGEHLRWVPPEGLELDADEVDATADLEEGVTAHLFVRSLADRAEYLLRTKVETKLIDVPDTPGHVRVQATVRATLDPATAAGGAPLGAGDWDLHLRLVVAGFHATAPVPGGELRVGEDGRVGERPMPLPQPEPEPRSGLAGRLKRRVGGA